jgi:hypothetical protein
MSVGDEQHGPNLRLEHKYSAMDDIVLWHHFTYKNFCPIITVAWVEGFSVNTAWMSGSKLRLSVILKLVINRADVYK